MLGLELTVPRRATETLRELPPSCYRAAMIRLDNVSKQNGKRLIFIEASGALRKGEKAGHENYPSHTSPHSLSAGSGCAVTEVFLMNSALGYCRRGRRLSTVMKTREGLSIPDCRRSPSGRAPEAGMLLGAALTGAQQYQPRVLHAAPLRA